MPKLGNHELCWPMRDTNNTIVHVMRMLLGPTDQSHMYLYTAGKV